MTRTGHGFALVEALVALLLLAIGIHGAASTMIRGQAELRATLLATRAADLAADLAEQVRAGGVDALGGVLEEWQRTVATALSTASSIGSAQGSLEQLPPSGGLPASHSIVIQWWDPGLRAPRRLELPMLLATVTERR